MCTRGGGMDELSLVTQAMLESLLDFVPRVIRIQQNNVPLCEIEQLQAFVLRPD
jgi:hypothetical protein